MKNKFTISNDLTLLTIESLPTPSCIREFSTAKPTISLTLANKKGEIFHTVIDNLALTTSCNKVLLSKNKNSFLLTPNTPISEILWKSQVEIQEKTHNLTIITGEKSKFLIENNSNFLSIDMKSNFIQHLVFDDILFLQFEREIYLVKYKDDYQIVHFSNYHSLAINQNNINILEKIPSMEGIEISQTMSIDNNNLTIENPQYFLSRQGNFTEKTFPLAFFERVKHLPNDYILQFMTDSFDENSVSKLKSYLGNFQEITLFEKETVILNYPAKTRSFSLVLVGNLVDNVVEL